MANKLAELLGIAAAVCLALTACGGSSQDGSQETAADTGVSSSIAEESTSEAPASTPIEDAVAECGLQSNQSFDVGDEGYTLIIDGKGDEDSKGADIIEIVCVLVGLDVSDAIIGRIDSTRALDGTQDGTWGDYRATWGYHPDNGLNMIIEYTG